MEEETFRNIIYFIVIILFPFNVYAAYQLRRLSTENKGIPALRERHIVAGILAIASASGAILALARLTETRIPTIFSIFLNGLAAILIGVPSLYWLWMYKVNGMVE